jgi:hypothetical protein
MPIDLQERLAVLLRKAREQAAGFDRLGDIVSDQEVKDWYFTLAANLRKFADRIERFLPTK